MIRSLQIIDSLRIGGAERMAVNIANALTGLEVESHICVTRKEGPLVATLNKNVKYLFLNRKSTFDVSAVLKLKRYVKNNKIDVIHAHGTSFLIASIIKVLNSSVKLIWHDHHGDRINNTSRLKLKLLKLASKKMSAIYCVNNEIKQWAESTLYCNDVKFISNFPTLNSKISTQLKGNVGKRVLYVANLREPKNHIFLFRAFKKIVEEFNEWTLHCIGSVYDDDYSKELIKYIEANKLENHIFIYGEKEDISNIISQSNIGVLSSSSEGLPMALLEYGLGELPVLSTDVGHCGQLIPNADYGILIDSNDEEALVLGLRYYINDEGYRRLVAKNFHQNITSEYSEKIIINTIIKDYSPKNHKNLETINGI